MAILTDNIYLINRKYIFLNGDKLFKIKFFGRVALKIRKKGIHHIRSLNMMFNPNFNGNSSLISAIENPIDRILFP